MARADGEGTILKRVIKRKDGTSYIRWQARVSAGSDPHTGRRRRLQGPYRASEDEALADKHALLEQVAKQDIANTPSTVAGYLDEWLDYKRDSVRRRTADEYERSIRLHLKPLVGRLRLAELRPLHCRNLQTKLLREHSLSVARKARAVLHAALNDAVMLELIPRNPMAAVPGLPTPRAELGKWKPHDAAAFLVALRGHRLYPLFYTILSTGLRAGETLGLKWTDLRDKSLYVTEQMMTVGAPELSEVKTPRGRRRLRLADDALAVLEVQRLRLAEESKRPAWQERGLMFPAVNGRPLRLENARRVYKRTIYSTWGRDENDKPVRIEGSVPYITIHDLRHHHLSRLVALGHDIAAVSAKAGHSRISTTMDFYVDPDDQRVDETAVSMDDLTDSHPGLHPQAPNEAVNEPTPEPRKGDAEGDRATG
jgi:integrase